MDTINEKTDIVIIGAGAVGCAVGRELSTRYPNKSIAVIEKLSGVALETSGKSSEVLHDGLHQNPDFLKSKLVLRGNKMAKEYIKRKGLQMLECGMMVAVPWESVGLGLWRETSSFLGLVSRARKQKVDIELLSPWRIHELEPDTRAAFGVFVPGVCVINAPQFVNEMKKDAENNGVKFHFNTTVTNIYRGQNDYIVETSRGNFRAGAIVNAAGLYADDIARMAGFTQYKIYPWRGEYYEVVGEKAGLVRRLIYPVVPHNSPGKGIHFSPRVGGRLFIGPNAKLVPRKDYYEENKTPVEEFLKSVQRFLPQITANDLRWAYSGIRPKTTNKPEETDFIISLDGGDPPFVNLIGIESPGLAACMGIAEFVGETLKRANPYVYA